MCFWATAGLRRYATRVCVVAVVVRADAAERRWQRHARVRREVRALIDAACPREENAALALCCGYVKPHRPGG